MLKQADKSASAISSGNSLQAANTAEKLQKAIRRLDALIGNTKLYQLNYPCGNLYTKMESQNFFGSIKDRPAFYILKKAIEDQLIDVNTTVIESTSGNFGISLANICRALGIRFIPVIDPNISAEKESILHLNGCQVLKVTERDATGGYLLNRLGAVKAYMDTHPGAYTTNQYGNPNNYLSYYYTLAEEIVQQCPKLDYLFVSVSTGGTITGLSLRLKEHFKHIRIIGVDVEGSLIFNDKPAIRRISGMGSSIRTAFFDQALIDDYIILSEAEIVQGCRNLYAQHHLFMGGSSGAAYAAADQVMKKMNKHTINALFIAPDAGHSYIDTIYNQQWVEQNQLL